MPGIWYTEDIRDGQVFDSTATGRKVHLLLAECAPKLRKLTLFLNGSPILQAFKRSNVQQ